jgi:hypothetical protein
VARFDNDRLDGVLVGNQAVAHGVLLQHAGSVMQVEFADGVEGRTGLTACPDISSAVGAAIALGASVIARLPS